MYEDIGDAEMRLANSIILLAGRPVMVHSFSNLEDEGLSFSYTDIGTGEGGHSDLDSPLVSIEPVSIGYVNREGDSLYVQRIPIRKWKQGLSSANVEVVNTVARGLVGRALDPSYIINTPEMAACILNEYPSFDESLGLVTSGKVSRSAFCRAFALSSPELGPVGLSYKGEAVGWMDSQGPVLAPLFKYLKEEFEEVLR